LLNYNLTQLKSSVLVGTELLSTLWGLYLLGLSYEVDSNQYSEAIQYYLSAAEIMSKYRGDKSIEYFVIEENILYRLGYIQLHLEQLEDGISTMKTYSISCSKWGEQFKPQKQINVLKKLTETFAKEPSLGSATTLQIPNMPDVSTNNSIESVDELIETQSRYEASVYQMIEYPKAGSENFQLLDMSDLFMNNWRKFNINSPKFTRQLLNSMYRVAKFTFQSPKVVRHIINLLYSLSEFDECKLALESYKNLIEKSIEVKATCIFDPIAKTEDEQTVPIPTNMEPLEAVVETYLLGIKFLINQFEDPKTALEYAEKSLILALPYNQLLTPLISRVYQYLGICHGQMTLTCLSKDDRSYHHTSSLDAFKKSIEYNPDNWESCYFQALAHAQGREIESAVELVKKSLEIEPSFTQSWHLLVLLMSAQRQFEQALELCDVGIQESSSKLTNLDNDSMVPETSVVDEEEIFNLKVTQNIIKETLYGHKEALSCQGQLFTLFTRIYGNIEQMPTEGMSSTTLLKSPSPVPRILAEEPNNSVRTTPRRRPSESHLTPNLPRSLSQSHLMSPETSSTLIKSPMYLLPRSTQSLPHLMHKRNRGIDTLVSLWLMSATMYCKLSKFKDAKLATEEAENCCPTSPDVWAKVNFLLNLISIKFINCYLFSMETFI
jgi:tetratricopeptide (TPR) repeat protein